jgi:hypothetical protein
LRDCDGRVEEPARVVAQVEHERLDALAGGPLRLKKGEGEEERGVSEGEG